MPFTISHTAVILPLSRLLARWRLLSAAIIGAMVPDFRIFFPGIPRVETHSALALLTFCLPVGLLTYWVFQRLIKTPLLEVMPDGPFARWRVFAAEADIRSLRQWLLAAGGILGGALSHLIWDGFTHENGRGVRMFPLLDESIIDIGRRHVPAVYVMQDVGSLVGLVVVIAIMCYGLRAGRQAPLAGRRVRRSERAKWALTFTIAAVVLTLVFFGWGRLGHPPHSIVGRVSDVAIASLRGLAAALLCVSVALQFRLRSSRYRSSGPER